MPLKMAMNVSDIRSFFDIWPTISLSCRILIINSHKRGISHRWEDSHKRVMVEVGDNKNALQKRRSHSQRTIIEWGGWGCCRVIVHLNYFVYIAISCVSIDIGSHATIMSFQFDSLIIQAYIGFRDSGTLFAEASIIANDATIDVWIVVNVK